MDLENIEPLELIEQATFEEFQALAHAVNYNPQLTSAKIKLHDLSLCAEYMTSTIREELKCFAKSKSEEIYNRFILAAKGTTELFDKSKDYRKILNEIEDKIKGKQTLSPDKSNSFADIEDNITNTIIRKGKAKILKLSRKDKDKFNKEFKKFVEKQAENNEKFKKMLEEQGLNTGKEDWSSILAKSGGAAGGVAVGTFAINGIWISSLSFYNTILLAFGLYAAPLVGIGAVVFGVVFAGLIGYQAGVHNFKKTNPFVLRLAAIRKRLIAEQQEELQEEKIILLLK